ncbi:glycosyltransferase family 4 protein [Brevibacillus borstelensis]|uniref:glycosyltransferase family 4 protein n=1 Tax=Brevibacillus borstelensis TaxID=45462 RepID=UPI00287F5013|nr:glycosyltransferase family 4 protein [Brevibacillus borstelensis]WNF04901.1 glycosyltransferase family 4 protein [Brevibacillus borstelensis]
MQGNLHKPKKQQISAEESKRKQAIRVKILFATYGQIPQAGKLPSPFSLLQKELEQRGHQVDVLGHHPDMQRVYLISQTRSGPWTLNLQGQSVPKAPIKERVYDEVFRYYQKYLPHVHPWIRWREIERYTFELILSLFDLGKYDLIHTHDALATRAVWRVKPSHVPLLYQCGGLLRHDPAVAAEVTSPDSLKARYVACEEYMAATSCDQAIVPSAWLKKVWQEEFFIPDGHSAVIHRGMEFAPFLQWLQYEPYPPVEKKKGVQIIACPPGLDFQSGSATLLDALARLKQQRDDFLCWMVGDGPWRGELEAYCREKDLTRHVLLLGERTDWPSLLAKTDIVVWPAPAVDFPLPLMEAQVAGTAIVACDSSVIQEMVRHGETGLLFEAGNSLELSERLLQLLDTPELASHLRNSSKTYGMNEWSSAKWAEQVEQLYLQMKRKHRVAAPAGEKKKSRDSVAQLFAFRLRHRLDEGGWNEFAHRLPASYLVPDFDFLRVLTETNQFDE